MASPEGPGAPMTPLPLFVSFFLSNQPTTGGESNVTSVNPPFDSVPPTHPL